MQTLSVALVGNPNAGKTSLFNLLTKQSQRVANWPGMTVERQTGTLSTGGIHYNIIDLPGCYALNNDQQLDEQLTTNYLIEDEPDLIINVLNACQMPLHLYLTIQLLETNIPMIIAVNFIDQITDRTALDLNQLAKHTNCTVVPISARNNQGICDLKATLLEKQKKRVFTTHKAINSQVKKLKPKLPKKLQKNWIATNLLEQNITISNLSSEAEIEVKSQRANIASAFDDEPEIIIADIRYNLLQKIVNDCQKKPISTKSSHSTNKIDKICLDPWLGLPIFMGIMYLMFSVCLVLGSSIQEPFAATCELWLVRVPLSLIDQVYHLPNWLLDILFNGVGTAITTTLSFIPPLFLLFTTLSILEQSGYMARAAFITDKIMGMINLPGRAFVSLLIGFGCNVPAIISTRTLQNHEDRILTAMMTPFMSCTARLALYVVLVQAFFKNSGSIVIFAIYLTGILAGILTGLIIKQLLLSETSLPMILELPDYIRPSIKYTWQDTYKRIKRFIARTFKFMLVACFCLAALNTIPGYNSESLLANMAKKINFLLAPMGIIETSWPTTIALIMGTVAKEVMVGVFHTLGTLHGHSPIIVLDQLWVKSSNIWHSWFSNTDSADLNHTVENLRQLFHNKASVIAFLLFSCLYLPCFSTLSALKKECGSKWGNIASIWSLILAYSTATMYYQWATYKSHPSETIIISILLLSVISGFLCYVKKFR